MFILEKHDVLIDENGKKLDFSRFNDDFIWRTVSEDDLVVTQKNIDGTISKWGLKA